MLDLSKFQVVYAKPRNIERIERGQVGFAVT